MRLISYFLLFVLVCNPLWAIETLVKESDQVIANVDARIKNKLKGSFIIGGGIAYESINYRTNKANDIDGMFVFSTRQDLEQFLRQHNKDEVRTLFGFEDDFIYFTPQELSYFIDNKVEVLRVAGNIQGIKITIKLTDFETLSNMAVNKAFHVMSKLKDRRIYPRVSLRGEKIEVFLINKQLTRDQDASFIILDNHYFPYQDTLVPGLITDFLITAKAISEYNNEFAQIQTAQRDKFAQLTSEKGCLNKGEVLSQHLVREQRFSENYRKNINNDFQKIIKKAKLKIPACQDKPLENGFLVFIDPHLFEQPNAEFHYEPLKDIPAPVFPENGQELVLKAAQGVAKANEKLTLVPLSEAEKSFSSNPELGKIYVGEASDNKPVYFYKIMRKKDPLSIYFEANNVKNLQQIYSQIVKPTYVDATYRFVIQPYFDGEPMAKYLNINTEQNDEFIESIELKRAEELLQGYVNSVEEASKNTTVGQRIHKLYYDRLIGERIKSYYENKDVTLPSGEKINFETLKNLTPVINGKRYDTMDKIIETAKHYLNPPFLNSKVKIYGFADNHAGNVLVDEKGNFVTIDYEYASIAHPCLDIAKTYYNDVYFDILFPSQSDAKFSIDVKIDTEKNEIIINHDYQLPRSKKALLAIKQQGILEPFLAIAQQKNYNISDAQEILRSALFAAGFLNKNIFEYPQNNAFLAFAMLIEIASSNQN